ncbi:hypothetical protein B0H11DRAFT_645933 [Mycena galericulata]|nr:hypothetical protein B0H11DRAFT_645933 [Mycena galericulata]
MALPPRETTSFSLGRRSLCAAARRYWKDRWRETDMMDMHGTRSKSGGAGGRAETRRRRRRGCRHRRACASSLSHRFLTHDVGRHAACLCVCERGRASSARGGGGGSSPSSPPLLLLFTREVRYAGDVLLREGDGSFLVPPPAAAVLYALCALRWSTCMSRRIFAGCERRTYFVFFVYAYLPTFGVYACTHAGQSEGEGDAVPSFSSLESVVQIWAGQI